MLVDACFKSRVKFQPSLEYLILGGNLKTGANNFGYETHTHIGGRVHTHDMSVAVLFLTKISWAVRLKLN